MNHSINCKKCDSAHVVLQKRGFSFLFSILGFILMTSILIFIWIQVFKSQDYENAENYKLALKYHWTYNPVDWVNNKALWIGTTFLLASSFLAGMIGSQRNRIICLNCGNSKRLKTSNVELQQG